MLFISVSWIIALICFSFILQSIFSLLFILSNFTDSFLSLFHSAVESTLSLFVLILYIFQFILFFLICFYFLYFFSETFYFFAEVVSSVFVIAEFHYGCLKSLSDNSNIIVLSGLASLDWPFSFSLKSSWFLVWWGFVYLIFRHVCIMLWPIFTPVFSWLFLTQHWQVKKSNVTSLLLGGGRNPGPLLSQWKGRGRFFVTAGEGWEFQLLTWSLLTLWWGGFISAAWWWKSWPLTRTPVAPPQQGEEQVPHCYRVEEKFQAPRVVFIREPIVSKLWSWHSGPSILASKAQILNHSIKNNAVNCGYNFIPVFL